MTEKRIQFETAKLGKTKGFDEVVRDTWVDGPHGPIEASGPKDDVLIETFVGFYLKQKFNPDGLIEKLKGMKATPLSNSMLPKDAYARPSQDLLNRWLRQTHGMTITVAMQITFKNCQAIICIKDRERRVVPGTFATWEDAMEAGLQHALRLLETVSFPPVAK